MEQFIVPRRMGHEEEDEDIAAGERVLQGQRGQVRAEALKSRHTTCRSTRHCPSATAVGQCWHCVDQLQAQGVDALQG